MGLPLKGLTKIFVILYSSFTGYIELELESRKMFHLTLRKRPSNAEDRVLGEKKTWNKEFNGYFDSLIRSYSFLVLQISSYKK